jgi:hypothetical protein
MIKAWLLKLLGFGKTLIAFLLPIVARHTASLLDAALPVALEIVQTFEATPADGAAKRDLAVNRLRDALVREGHAAASDLSESTLNWLVETALQKLRSTAPTP